jgi:PIN domain nuclease of toxin-antitoxin system
MIILDSHIWFWWINQELHRFSAKILEAIKSADRVGVSPVSCFELALAHKRGRLALSLPPFDRIIIATALQLNRKLASVDSQFSSYPELNGILLQ